MIFWVTNLIIKHNMKHPRIQVYQFDSLILFKKLNLKLFISLSTFFVKYKVIYRYEILIREIWEYHWIIRKAAIFHPRRTTSQTLWQIPAWWHTHISMLSLSEDSMTLRLILSVLIVLLLLLTLTHAYLDPEKDSDGDGLKYDKQYLLLIEFIYISRIKANHIP